MPKSDPTPRLQVLEAAIDELRRLYDALASNYDNIKLKILGLIAAELAFVPFIFSDFHFPHDISSIIFFGIGTAILSSSFAISLWAIATSDWMVPCNIEETRKSNSRYKTRGAFLEYLREDYESCIGHCLGRISRRAKAFNISLMLFAVGTITLFVIKYTHGGM